MNFDGFMDAWSITILMEDDNVVIRMEDDNVVNPKNKPSPKSQFLWSQWRSQRLESYGRSA